MEQTKLEFVLDIALEALGAELSPRKYWDEIKTAAAVDDVILGDTYNPVKVFSIQISGKQSPFSEDQQSAWDGMRVLFRRRAILGHIGLEYGVYPTSEVLDAEKKSDEIIRRREYRYESLNILYAEQKLENDRLFHGNQFGSATSPMMTIEIGANGKMVIDNLEKLFKDEPQYLDALEKIERFTGTNDVNGLCRAVVAFLREHKA